MITQLAQSYSRAARERRASVFRNSFAIDAGTRILDLGSETGAGIRAVLQGTAHQPHNVFVADIEASAVAAGARLHGFTPVVIPEDGQLPFEDGFFDIVYCSSVIEHVTVPKALIWSVQSGRDFKEQAWRRQQAFAQEIRRVGRQYFVQTPNRNFPLESHTWLPFVGWLPRPALLRVLQATNTFWYKRTMPDWHLLTAREMAALFPDGQVVREKSFGLTKSLIALKRSAA